jgi:hypothetical protein
MGKESSVKSLKARNLVSRILKIAFYLAGFLLLYHLVYMEASGNLGGQFFGSAAKFPTYYILCAWAAVFFVQLLCAALFKKSIKARMIIVALIAFATVLFPVVYCDFVVKKQVEDMAPQYEAKGFDFDSYEIQLGNYGDLASDLNSTVTDFTQYYNIEYDSKVYGSRNTDWSDYAYTKDGVTFEVDGNTVAPEEFFLEDAYVFGKDKGDAYYSKNGMYADGYIFGFTQARYILEVYYNTKKAYLAEGKDIDEELDTALSNLINNSGSKWNQYRNSSAYTEFYSDDLTDVANARRYYVTEERLSAILSVLGANLGSTGVGVTIGMLLGVNLTADLSLSDLLTAANALGLTLTEEEVMELLAQFSYYQSPQTFPIFYFIEDDDLRDYAYAKYYGETHGAKVGSVLIGERVGEVTMDKNGNPAEEDIDARLESFQRMDLDKSYMPVCFKWMALRANCLIFAGIIPFSIIAAYFFAYLERKSFNKLISGGKK